MMNVADGVLDEARRKGRDATVESKLEFMDETSVIVRYKGIEIGWFENENVVFFSCKDLAALSFILFCCRDHGEHAAIHNVRRAATKRLDGSRERKFCLCRKV